MLLSPSTLPVSPLSSRVASAFSDAAAAATTAGERRAVNQLQGCRHVPATYQLGREQHTVLCNTWIALSNHLGQACARARSRDWVVDAWADKQKKKRAPPPTGSPPQPLPASPCLCHLRAPTRLCYLLLLLLHFTISAARPGLISASWCARRSVSVRSRLVAMSSPGAEGKRANLGRMSSDAPAYPNIIDQLSTFSFSPSRNF